MQQETPVFVEFFPLAILFFVVLVGFWTFDQLVRLEYSSYRTSWEEDDKPHGFFFLPSETKALGGSFVRLRSSLAFNRCFFVWLFSTPEWMRRERRALRWVFWWRASVLTWNAGVLGHFFVFVPFLYRFA